MLGGTAGGGENPKSAGGDASLLCMVGAPEVGSRLLPYRDQARWTIIHHVDHTLLELSEQVVICLLRTIPLRDMLINSAFAGDLSSQRRCRRVCSISALPLSHDTANVEGITAVKLRELIVRQHEDEELVPYFGKVREGSEELKAWEEFLLRDDVLCRRWRKGDGGELVQVVVPLKFQEALIYLAHEDPLARHLGVRKIVERLRLNF